MLDVVHCLDGLLMVVERGRGVLVRSVPATVDAEAVLIVSKCPPAAPRTGHFQGDPRSHFRSQTSYTRDQLGENRAAAVTGQAVGSGQV